MGMFKDVLGMEKNLEEIPAPESVLLASGGYKSDADLVLTGYKTFQKRYVVPRVALRMFLVAMAVASSVMMILTGGNEIFSALLLFVSAVVGWFFITEPMGNRKRLAGSLELLRGVEYKAEIYTDRIVVLTTYIPPELLEEKTPPPEEEKEGEDKNDGDEERDDASASKLESEEAHESEGEREGDAKEDDDKETESPPGTVIHLDSHIVDFIDREGMFVISVKKSHVFVIPKAAFSEGELAAVRERLSAILGIRYIIK
jgi:hypothetical protein